MSIGARRRASSVSIPPARAPLAEPDTGLTRLALIAADDLPAVIAILCKGWTAINGEEEGASGLKR